MTKRSGKGQLQLAAWRDGADGFFRWLADVQPMVPSEQGGYRPAVFSPREEAEIRKALDGEYSTVAFCWPRRHGKTVASALIIVWRFLTRRTQTVAIVANSATQSVDTAFKLVKTILEQTAYTRALVDAGTIRLGADWIDYDGLGSRIQGFPANSPALYGKKLSIAQVSELHAARTDDVYQNLASATIDTADGLVLVDSTVGAKSSPLYQLFTVAERGDDPSLFFSYIFYRDLTHAIAEGPAWIDERKLRSRAAQMLPAMFAQQHLNQWSAGSNALFPEDLVARCIRESYPVDVPTLADGRAYAVGAGLDRAYGFSLHGDATVTTAVLKVLQDEDEHYFVLASEAVKFSSAGGIKKNLERYRRDFGMSRAALEAYNAQDIASWCGEQDFEHEIIHPTAERQSNAFTALWNAASEGRLHVHPIFRPLADEMRQLEYRLEATGTRQGSLPKFEAAKGYHDDHVYSLAWAVYALREIELAPYVVGGIHCDAIGPAATLCFINGGDHVPACSEQCRTFADINKLYSKYAPKAGIAPMSIPNFFRYKVRNTGSRSHRT